MLESILAAIINRILGDYVSNLETKQLNVGMWQGDVKLKNLTLKKTAFDNLGLPFDVQESILGDLVMKIPWQNLKANPVRIEIQDVLMIIGLKSEKKFDPEREEARLQKIKMDKLDASELISSSAASTEEEEKKNATFLEKLRARIIRNIQIKIERIHIRFEDSLSNPSNPFCFGVTLKELSIVSTNEEFIESFVDTLKGDVHKLVNLNALSIYWDSKSEFLTGTSDEKLEKLRQIINEQQKHEYIMNPVSGIGKFTLRKYATATQPKTTADIFFDEIGLSINDYQYRDIQHLFQFITAYNKTKQFHKFIPIDRTAASLWKFANNCVLQNIIKRKYKWTWAYFSKRKEQRLKYITVFCKKVMKTASDEHLKSLAALEKELSFEDIRLYRFMSYKKMKSEEAEKKSSGYSWAASFWYKQPEKEKTSDLQKIYETIDFDEKESIEPQNTSKDAIELDLKVLLKKACFSVKEHLSGHRINSVILANFEELEASFLNRSDSFQIGFELMNVLIEDGSSCRTLFPTILKSKENRYVYELENSIIVRQHKGKLLKLSYEHQPIQKKVDGILFMEMQPLELVYNYKLMRRLQLFFEYRLRNETLDALLSAANETIQGLTTMTKAGFQFALQEHKSIEIKINMDAPIILLPEDCDDIHKPVFYTNLGKILVKSQLVEFELKEKLRNERIETEEEYNQLKDLMYDKFSIDCSNLQVSCYSSCQLYLERKTKHLSSFIDKTDLNLFLENCILPSHLLGELKRFKIKMTLPKLSINFSNYRYKTLMRLLDVYFPDAITLSMQLEKERLLLFPNEKIVQSPESYNTIQELGIKDEFFDANEDILSSRSLSTEKVEVNPAQTIEPQNNSILLSFDIEQVLGKVFTEENNSTKLLAYIKLEGFIGHINLTEKGQNAFLRLESFMIIDELDNVPFFETEKKQKDLLLVNYKREADLMKVDVELSAVKILLISRTIDTFQNYLMDTFQQKPSQAMSKSVSKDVIANTSVNSRILLGIKLNSVLFILANVESLSSFASIQLLQGSVNLDMKNSALVEASGTLKSFDFKSQSILVKTSEQLIADWTFLQAKGDHVVDFTYKVEEEADSLIIKSGSLLLHYDHEFIQKIIKYAEGFGKSNSKETQSNLTPSKSSKKLMLDVQISTPIIEIYPDATKEAIIAYPGEVIVKNTYNELMDVSYDIQIQKISMLSILKSQELKILEDTNISVMYNMITNSNIRKMPDKIVSVIVGKVEMRVDEYHYFNFFKSLYFLLDSFNALTNSQSNTSNEPIQVALEIEDNNEEAPFIPIIKSGSISSDIHSTNSIPYQEDSRIFNMDVVVECQSINLDMMNAKGSKHFPLASFKLNQTKINFCILADKTVEYDIWIHSFVLLDTRLYLNRVYREVIPPSIHEEGQLMLHATQCENGSQMIKITLDSPQIIFILDHIFALQKFVTNMPSRKKSDAPQSNVSSGMFFMITIVDANIFVLENPASKATEAIQIELKRAIFSQQGNMSLILDGLVFNLCNMDSKAESKICFLERFDVNVTLELKPTNGTLIERITNVWLVSSSLTFRISYQDVQLAFSIAKQIYTPSSDESTSLAPSVPPTASAELLEASVIESQPTDAKLTINIDGFRFILIDDLSDTHLPIIDIQTKALNVDVLRFTADLEVDTTLEIQINNFNVRNSHWEPFLEPWKVQLTGTRKGQCLEVGIISKEDLYINLTQSLMEFFADLILIKNSTKNVTAVRKVNAPYTIYNQTGYALAVWPTAEPEGVKITEIPHGSKIPWQFEDWRKMRQGFNASNMLSIQVMGGECWEKLQNISVDKEGIKAYPLRPKDKVSHKLVVDVSLDKNIKIVTIRSSIIVRNETMIPMEMVVVNASLNEISSISQIAPGGIGAVATDLVYFNGIKIRPNSSLNYKWSAASIYWRTLLHKTTYKFECLNNQPDTVPFRCILDVEWDEQLTKNNDYPFVTMTLRPPMELENLLPFDIKYRWMDRSAKYDFTGIVRKGQKSPFHNVDLNNSVALSFDVLETDLKSDIAIINGVEFDYSDEQIILTDSKNAKLNLGISYMPIGNSQATCVSIFSPYIILNKTGLNLYYRPDSFMGSNTLSAGQGFPYFQNKPFMFSYSNFEPIRNRACIKADDSDWSKPLSFETIGSKTAVVLQNTSRQSSYVLGMSISQGTGKYYKSRIVSITPRYIIRNNMESDIEYYYYIENGPLTDSFVVAANDQKPFHPKRPDEDEILLCFKRRGLDSKWSSPLNIKNFGRSYVRLYSDVPGNKGQESLTSTLLRLDTRNEETTLFVLINKEDGAWPFRIENFTDTVIDYYQKDSSIQYRVFPGKTAKYTWDFPSLKNKSLVIRAGTTEKTIHINEIGILPPFRYKFKADGKTKVLIINILADGPVLVAHISPYDEKNGAYVRKGSESSGSGSDSLEFDLRQIQTQTLFKFFLNLEGIGISIINHDLTELIYIYGRRLSFIYTDGNLDQVYKFTLHWLQIDNQLYSCSQPIIFYPTLLLKKESKMDIPLLNTSIFKSKDTSHGVEYYKYASFLLQEVTIDVDESILLILMDVFKFTQKFSDNENKHEDDLSIPIPTVLDLSTDLLYFEVFQIHPMKLNISFTKNDKDRVYDPWTYLFKTLSVTLANVHNAPIHLKALIYENPIIPRKELVNMIVSNYIQDILSNIFVFIGYADAFGGIAGNILLVGSGFKDVFYEPYLGVVSDNPEDDFGVGLYKGATSLLKKTVFGFSDSFSKFTGSLGKGASVMTLDDQFQEQRRLNQTRNKPRHIVNGFTIGAKSFFDGVTSGIAGVVGKPIEGASKEGVTGFFKGIGKGLLGAVAKPAVGVFDFASRISEGVKNTTTMFDETEIDRTRMPRYISYDRILRTYSSREALGQFILCQVENQKFSNEYYIAHIDIRNEDAVAVVSTQNILYVKPRKMELVWNIYLEYYVAHKINSQGISLLLNNHPEFDHQFIPSPDVSSSQWFCEKILEAKVVFSNEIRAIE